MNSKNEICVNPTHSKFVNGKEIFSSVFHRDSPKWTCPLENTVYSFMIITQINGWIHMYFSTLKIDDYTSPNIEYQDPDTMIIFRLGKDNDKLYLNEIEYPIKL
jgi:hypothetical protein